jgi:hypothetical protein
MSNTCKQRAWRIRAGRQQSDAEIKKLVRDDGTVRLYLIAAGSFT